MARRQEKALSGCTNGSENAISTVSGISRICKNRKDTRGVVDCFPSYGKMAVVAGSVDGGGRTD
jgi:hypothetical protein